jgi:hypothetical protein
MDTNVGGRDRLARGALAVALALVAVWAFRTGRRGSAVAATLGALGFGFNAVTCFCGVNATVPIFSSFQSYTGGIGYTAGLLGHVRRYHPQSTRAGRRRAL